MRMCKRETLAGKPDKPPVPPQCTAGIVTPRRSPLRERGVNPKQIRNTKDRNTVLVCSYFVFGAVGQAVPDARSSPHTHKARLLGSAIQGICLIALLVGCGRGGDFDSAYRRGNIFLEQNANQQAVQAYTQAL